MSSPTGGFTGTLSPDAVQTAIDAVMFEEYQREQQPGYLRASDEMFFQQGPLEKLAFIWDEASGVGAFDEVGEQEDFVISDAWIGNQKTKASQKYQKSVAISDEAFRADQVGKRAELGRQVGDRARLTQDKKAILNTYADAFAGSVNTTPDGDALASNSHTTLKGVNVDNLETGSATPDNMWTAVNSLASQKGQDGEAGSHVFEGLLVPFTLYKTSKEILNSSLLADSAENNLNVFDTDYGSVQIRASIFLGSAFNAASNANTSYHLVSRNHMITRKVFYGLVTVMIDPTKSDNDTWVLRSKYHECVFPGSWCGYVGSNGTT